METIGFSVIITTHNRPDLLVLCLESVLAQSLPGDERYEIIVVDDGSRRGTAKILAPYCALGNLHCFRQPQQGWGVARRLGAQHSHAEILVFLDDDCIAPPGWLARYAQVYKAYPDVDGVGGGLCPGSHVNIAGRKQYLGHLAYFNALNRPLGLQADQPGRAWFTFGGNRTFRRDIWLAAQPDEPMWYYDDYAIDLRLREIGAWIYYEPAAWVYHHYRLSVLQRIRAAYRYGRSEGRLEGPVIGELEARSLWDKWQRLKREAPEASVWSRTWYAMTQPLAWLARCIGRWSGF